MKQKTLLWYLIAAMTVMGVAAFIDAHAADREPLSVYVVNYPLQYFTERIGGPDVRVTFPAPADGDPAFWKPSPEQVVAYQKADLILLNGASYAKWVSHVSLPASRMVDTSASYTDKLIPIEGAVTHSHGMEGKHEHGDVAFTTWLDPELAIFQAEAIRDHLVRKRPEADIDFNQRFDALVADLKKLDEQISEIVAGSVSLPLVFSHPVYQYFIRRYVLDGREVHWEPDEAPSPDQWAALNALLAEHPSEWMVWEGAPGDGTVEQLSKIGLNSLVFDPCGNVPESGNYLSVMQDNILNLKKAF